MRVQGRSVESEFLLQQCLRVPGRRGFRGHPGVPAGPVPVADRLDQRLPVGKLVDPGRGDVRALGQGDVVVVGAVPLQVDDHGAVLGDGGDQGADRRIAGEVPEQQVPRRGRLGQGEGLLAVAHGDDPVAFLAVHRPVRGGPGGLVYDEIDGELAGRRIGIDERVAALELLRAAVGVGEPEAQPVRRRFPLRIEQPFRAARDPDEVRREPAFPDHGHRMFLGAQATEYDGLKPLRHRPLTFRGWVPSQSARDRRRHLKDSLA